MEEPDFAFKVGVPIGLACDKEIPKFALGSVQVTHGVHGTWAAATNGRLLVVHPVSCKSDQPFGTHLVPQDVLPDPRTLRDEFLPTISKTRKRWHSNDGSWADDSIEGRFPKAAEVIPVVESHTVSLTIDLRQLNLAAKSLGICSQITLLVPEPIEGEVRSAIGIAAIGCSGIAVLMPCTSSEHFDDREHFNAVATAFAAATEVVRPTIFSMAGGEFAEAV